MEYVNGRIFKDPALPGLSPDERRQVFSAATDILSRIHKVNIKEAGLEDYGKAGIWVYCLKPRIITYNTCKVG